MIKVENLRKTYGSLVAVDGISFEIKEGETFGLLGPNGAGKSTAIHMMCGFLEPDGGQITVNGEKDPSRAEVRRHLGAAPQSLALYDDLSGEENIAFFGSLYGLSGPALKKNVDEALEFVNLSDRRKDRVKTYSGGMQRRLNLACALVHDPPVLFLDEPTVGVDPQSRNLIFDNIAALTRGGKTVVYTTHYMEEAERLCDRVAIMDEGKILALDTVDALIAKYGGESHLEVEFEKAPQNTKDWPGTLEGTHYEAKTEKPGPLLAQLASSGNAIKHMKLDRPDLETVFFSLTGRSLRDT